MNNELLFEESEVNNLDDDLSVELDGLISDDTPGLKPGVKLPKNECQWREADLYFKDFCLFRVAFHIQYSATFIHLVTDAYQMPFINTYIQYIKSDRFIQLGFTSSQPLLRPKHWFQFADDAAITSGEEYETQILLNAFTTWCSWAKMTLRIDKCKTFGVSKLYKLQIPSKIISKNLFFSPMYSFVNIYKYFLIILG